MKAFLQHLQRVALNRGCHAEFICNPGPNIPRSGAVDSTDALLHECRSEPHKSVTLSRSACSISNQVEVIVQFCHRWVAPLRMEHHVWQKLHLILKYSSAE